MDTETLTRSKKEVIKEKCSDFPSMGIDLIKKTNFKVAAFLFLIGMFIFSDIFIENVLPKKFVDGHTATTQGTMLQLLAMVLSYLVLDLMISGGLL